MRWLSKSWNNTQLIYESVYLSKCNLLAFCTSSKYAKTSLSMMYSWLGTLKCKPIDGSGVALDASPPFTRQALKSFVVTSSTQINAGSWTTWDSFPWLIETNRRTGDPSEKLLLNETRLHRKSLFPTRFMPILPLSTPVIKTTNKRKYAHFIYS